MKHKLLRSSLCLLLAAALLLSAAGCGKDKAGKSKVKYDGGKVEMNDEILLLKEKYSEPGLLSDDPRMADDVLFCGDYAVSNGVLQIFYRMQYLALANAGYSDIVGLDGTRPFAGQMYEEQNMNWEQYFLTCAIQQFWQYAALAQAAADSGFEVDDETKMFLGTLETSLEEDAAGYGYMTATEYLQAGLGNAISVEDYCEYVRMYYTGYNFGYSLAVFSEEEISDYFDANEAKFLANYGLVKTDKHDVNVRHILIAPVDSDGDGEISEADWYAAEIEAQGILDYYNDNNPTEELFAELALQYTADENGLYGGLAEDVYVGQMDREYEDWCFAAGRKPGDTGIIKSQYGYYIMYFVNTCDTFSWHEAALATMKNESVGEIASKYQALYPCYVDYSKIVFEDNEAQSQE